MENQDSQTATSVSLACSKSCGRAGIFALGLSCLAFVLIGPLEKFDKLVAYGNYINLRFQLTEIIDDLDRHMKIDRCWRNFIQVGSKSKEINQWNLFELTEIDCSSDGEIKYKGQIIFPEILKDKRTTESKLKKSPPMSSKPFEQKSQSLKPGVQKADKIPPAPPSGLKVSGGDLKLQKIEELEKSLLALNDSDLLALARGVSNSQSLQIKQWMQLRYGMFWAKFGIIGKSAEERSEIRKKKEFPNGKEDVWIYVLTLEDIKTLQKYYHPKIEDFEEVQKAISFFEIPLIQVEVDLGFATTFIEFALFLSVTYFLIFLREGKKISNFYKTGTLIGAMGRDGFTVSVFLLFTLIPILASQRLAYSSLHGTKFFGFSFDWVFAHLTVIFSLFVAWELWSGRPLKLK